MATEYPRSGDSLNAALDPPNPPRVFIVFREYARSGDNIPAVVDMLEWEASDFERGFD